jgi:hypothetical protein
MLDCIFIEGVADVASGSVIMLTHNGSMVLSLWKSQRRRKRFALL